MTCNNMLSHDLRTTGPKTDFLNSSVNPIYRLQYIRLWLCCKHTFCTAYLGPSRYIKEGICVHGFRVQRFNVSFLVKPDGINESRRNSQSIYSAILCINQPTVPWICFFNPKSQPKFRVDVSTVEICIELWTSRMWLRKASVTFLIKLATSVARGGAEPYLNRACL